MVDMDRDQFFNNLFDGDAAEQTSGFQRQLSYENRIVRRVFNECGASPRSWGRLVNMCKAETSTHEMSFNWFNGMFPSFPARLCGRRIGYCGYRRNDAGQKTSLSLYQLSLPEILATKHNILTRTISKGLHAQQVDSEQPFIFVFPLVRKMFCAHNLSLPTLPEGLPRVRWLFQDNLCVESSAGLFQAIGPDWYAD